MELGRFSTNNIYNEDSYKAIKELPANVIDKDKFAHPTCKPVKLIERHISHTTQPNDIIADFFLGSGSTAVACKNTGRQYIGFEIQKKWYDVAKNRLDNVDATGQTSFLTF